MEELLQRIEEHERLENSIKRLERRIKQKKKYKEFKRNNCPHEVCIHMGEMAYETGWGAKHSVSIYQCLLCGKNFEEPVGQVIDAKNIASKTMSYEGKVKMVRETLKQILSEEPEISLEEAVQKVEKTIKEKTAQNEQ